MACALHPEAPAFDPIPGGSKLELAIRQLDILTAIRQCPREPGQEQARDLILAADSIQEAENVFALWNAGVFAQVSPEQAQNLRAYLDRPHPWIAPPALRSA